MEFKKNIDYVYIDIDLITPDEKFAIFYLEGEPTNYAIKSLLGQSAAKITRKKYEI